MNRCKDYIRFAAWFAGLSYLALWPLTTHGIGGIGLGAAWTLPPTLHAVGLLAAAYVVLRMLSMLVRHWRERRAAAAVPAITPEFAAARLQPPRWRVPAGARAVKPRSHFGLRRAPH